MGINISGFGSLNFGKPNSRQIPWNANQPVHDPASEADVRRIIYDQTELASGWMNTDNKKDSTWGPDLDPRAGRVFRSRENTAMAELKGGSLTPAFSLDFDPNNGNQLLSFDLTSKEGNYAKQVSWSNGEFESCKEERLLANGDKEVLSLQVDRATDTLTYTTEIIKAGQA
ncbi:hypothetical protein JST97_35730 [bacterium]|nr:hypothetical protein [bacterium]